MGSNNASPGFRHSGGGVSTDSKGGRYIDRERLFGGRNNALKIFDGQFPEEFRGRFTFSIFRDPDERLVSGLHNVPRLSYRRRS